jgi:hypothetical protein
MILLVDVSLDLQEDKDDALLMLCLLRYQSKACMVRIIDNLPGT